MARSPLTLAALATAAVPGLDIVRTSGFGGAGDGDFDSAILTTRDGAHLLIRIPRHQAAESQQSADLVALRAISAGVRSRLPFAVSTFIGQAPVGATRAVVYDFVYGRKASLGELTPGPEGSAASIGAAIAALHLLQTSFVADAGLPIVAPLDNLRAAVSVMDRAAATGLVPAPLLERWQAATEETSLWQFAPTVVHHALSADAFLLADDVVTGVLGWNELRVSDPARDLAWLMGAGEDVSQSALDAYAAKRPGDRLVTRRARLYAELEIAKWLLHGTDTRSTDIVDDAVDMLAGLVDTVENDHMNTIATATYGRSTDVAEAAEIPELDPTTAPLSITDVQEFLNRAERAV
jgi:aminoglycoside phosphotransferase (APT) family kinase protein